jgi:hypothetical protein
MTEPEPDFFAPPAPELLRLPSQRVIASLPGDLEDGAVLVSVPAPDDDLRSRAANIRREHGGTRMRYFGTGTITELG